MKRSKLFASYLSVLLALTVILGGNAVLAENMDPDDDGAQYAWGENIGWINFEPGGDGGSGAEVGDFGLTGYLWGENIGWINLSPVYGGVTNDGEGNLAGYAWGENTGWINFSPTEGGVYIDACGDFNGTAWGENIGWISFRSEGAYPFIVRTTWVSPIDTIAPETEPDSPVEGWYTADVVIKLAATDCGSGVREVHHILDQGDEVVTPGSSVDVDITAEGCHSLAYFSVDEEDNIESYNYVSFCIDKTPPEITLASPADEAAYYINDAVLADYTVTDAVSGVDIVTAPVPDGEPIHTSTTGIHLFEVSAFDIAGNHESVTHTYTVSYPGNMDPDDEGSQYAWSENAGWINFQPTWGPGVTVNDTALVGHAWGENIGWINLSPAHGGVTNDGAGNLAGYAWGENSGWISFSCANTGSCGTVDYGVTIDPTTGEFGGYAWGENIGWINFGPNEGGVETSWRGCIDNDGDGYGNPAAAACTYPEEDCNDNNPDVHPGMQGQDCLETPDNMDNDCDGQVDEDKCEGCFVNWVL